MKQLNLFLILVILVLLLCSCSTNYNSNEMTKVDNIELSFEDNISLLLRTNPDLVNVMDKGANLSITNVSYDYFNNQSLSDYYKDLFVNITYSNNLYVAELKGTDYSFISLVNLQSNEILKTFYLAKIKVGTN